MLYCRHHDVAGDFFVAGTVEWLSGLIDFKRGKYVVIGYSKFAELRPPDVKAEGWRSCCCQICLELDEILAVWLHLMIVTHGHLSPEPFISAKFRATHNNRFVNAPKCDDPSCPWYPTDPATYKLPHVMIERLKNVITDYDQLSTLPATRKLPYLYCGPCECGMCSGHTDGSGPEPVYLRCRGMEGEACSDCGWAAKYPVCPTLLAWDKTFSCRCRKKTASRAQPDVQQPQQQGSRKAADLLVKVETNFEVFVR